MKKYFVLISLFLLSGCSQPFLGDAVRVFTPSQGGTGISSAGSANVGDALVVSSTSPLQYKLSPITAGGGSATRTSTTNYLSFYDTPTTTTGTPNAIDNGTGLIFTNATSSRLFSTSSIFVNSTSTNLSVSNLTSLATTSIATTSVANLFQVGQTLTVDNINRAIIIGGTTAYTYSSAKMAVTIVCNGTFSCLALDGAQGLVKWKCIANGGDCGELYTDSSATFRFNVTSAKVGFAIFIDGSFNAAVAAGTRFAIGGNPPSSGAGKFYLTAESALSYALYFENALHNGPTLVIGYNGEIMSSSSLSLGRNGALANANTNGAFYVDRFGNTFSSGTLRIFQTSTFANVLPSSTLTYTMGNSTTRWLEGWFGTVNVGTSTYSISQLNGGLTITDQPNGAGNTRLTINSDGSINIPGSLTVGGCTGCGVGGGGLGVDYPSLATSTFVSYTGAIKPVDLGSFGITFNSATGTTSTISYINSTNVTTTGLVVTSLGNCNGSNQAIQSTNGVLSCGTLATGGTPPGIVATSTANYFAYYLNATTVTGTAEMAYMNGTLRVTTSTVLASTTISRLFIDEASQNGSIYARWPNPINTRTSTTVINNISESQCLPSTGVANFTAMYSDDETRILTMGTAANAALTLHTGHLSSAATAGNATYGNNNTLQTITPQTMGVNLTTWTWGGALTWNGYHVVIMRSSTPQPQAYVMVATSSFDINLAAKSSWVTSTISGRPVTSTDFIIGVYNDLMYVATSTTQLVTYSFSTSTRTFTYQASYTCSGANMLITNTRANSNGLYIGFNAAPFVRKYDGTCTVKDVTQGGGKYQAAPATTGPDLFASKFAIYGLQGTAASCKFKGW